MKATCFYNHELYSVDIISFSHNCELCSCEYQNYHFDCKNCFSKNICEKCVNEKIKENENTICPFCEKEYQKHKNIDQQKNDFLIKFFAHFIEMMKCVIHIISFFTILALNILMFFEKSTIIQNSFLVFVFIYLFYRFFMKIFIRLSYSFYKSNENIDFDTFLNLLVNENFEAQQKFIVKTRPIVFEMFFIFIVRYVYFLQK